MIDQKLRIIVSDKTWMEQTAIDQLKRVAELPKVKWVFGLPDLHPGKVPVGAVAIAEGIIYPHLIGNDIGCGMSFYSLDYEKKKVKLDRWIRKAEEVADLRQVDITDMLEENHEKTVFDESMGTIGGGNHFAEFQEVDRVYNEEIFQAHGLERNKIVLLIHSGSRGYGQYIYDKAIREHQAQKGLLVETEQSNEYLMEHDKAVRWAAKNRNLIANRMLQTVGINITPRKIIDSVHNAVTLKTIEGKDYYVHRKGAAPGDEGLVVIPGSRGTFTYLVKSNNKIVDSGYSLAHGAGRKWERSVCKARLADKYTKDNIQYTKFKGKVVCNNRNLLYEEAPEAYKNIDRVVQDLIDADLIEIVATFKPFLTYKS